MELNCLIVDDVLPQNKADELEKLHTSPEVPWFYNEDIAVGGEVNKTPGFNHTSILNGKTVSRFYAHHHWCPEIILRKINFREKHKLWNARAFMLLPTPKTKEYAAKHVDMDIPHLTILYYVNDSDGDTFFFGKDINDGISRRITPKKNRAIIFDGLIYHAGSLPTANKRVILNFNLLIG